MKLTKLLLMLASFTIVRPAQAQLIAQDGKTYKTVKIKKQEWMAENLNVTQFTNGDSISQARTSKEWNQACDERTPIWCYCNFDSANGSVYGKLYNIFAVFDLQKFRTIAPKGWRIPGGKDWAKLILQTGGNRFAGNVLKEAGTLHWFPPSNSDNSSGFTALPGGYYYNDGVFGELGKVGYWWSLDPSYYIMSATAGEVNIDNFDFKYMGCSIRLIKD